MAVPCLSYIPRKRSRLRRKPPAGLRRGRFPGGRDTDSCRIPCCLGTGTEQSPSPPAGLTTQRAPGFHSTKRRREDRYNNDPLGGLSRGEEHVGSPFPGKGWLRSSPGPGGRSLSKTRATYMRFPSCSCCSKCFFFATLRALLPFLPLFFPTLPRNKNKKQTK